VRQECLRGLRSIIHAWSGPITSITSINPRAADSVKNILQYRHINGGTVHDTIYSSTCVQSEMH
jgi:hypothetical protein